MTNVANFAHRAPFIIELRFFGKKKQKEQTHTHKHSHKHTQKHTNTHTHKET